MQGDECDWCGQTSYVIRVASYGKPLCEFCRMILRTENKKAQKKRIRARNRHSCFICGQEDGARKMCGEPFCLCPEHRADFTEEKNKKKKEQKNKEGRDQYRRRNSPDLKAARADRIVRYYCEVFLKAKDLEPVCVDCGSKKEIVAVKTKRGLILLCADCRARLYVRSETWKRAARWLKKENQLMSGREDPIFFIPDRFLMPQRAAKKAKTSGGC